MKKAFTLVEVMIVVVIIGLLAAMVIPAIMKIRDTSIMRAYKLGQALTPDQQQRVREILLEEAERNKQNVTIATFDAKRVTSSEPAHEEVMPTKAIPSAFQTLVVKEKTYVLIPKQYNPTEITIDGQIYWLVPSTK